MTRWPFQTIANVALFGPLILASIAVAWIRRRKAAARSRFIVVKGESRRQTWAGHARSELRRRGLRLWVNDE